MITIYVRTEMTRSLEVTEAQHSSVLSSVLYSCTVNGRVFLLCLFVVLLCLFSYQPLLYTDHGIGIR